MTLNQCVTEPYRNIYDTTFCLLKSSFLQLCKTGLNKRWIKGDLIVCTWGSSEDGRETMNDHELGLFNFLRSVDSLGLSLSLYLE